MEKTFSFYISAENFTYSFSLPMSMGQNVDATGLRHPDYKKVNSASEFLNSVASYSELVPISSFQDDMNLFVSYLERQKKPLETIMLFDALAYVCKKHIERFGRLIYGDLLSYVDVFIYVDYAIFQSDLSTYHNLYNKAVYYILNKFPNNVIFQGPFGSSYTWADVPEK